MDQIERTRLRYLSEARRAELVASTVKDERAQDKILDETVWRRLRPVCPVTMPDINPSLGKACAARAASHGETLARNNDAAWPRGRGDERPLEVRLID